jgi:DUF1009 family protein
MPVTRSTGKPVPARVGLIAGWGRFPVVVAESLAAQGCEVYCLGIKDHADPVLRSICHDYEPLGIARLGQAVRYFRRHGVEQATMAGKIHKVLLFQKWYWLKHFPDWEFVRTFYPHFITQTQDRKDDTMLGTFVQAFGRRGVRCVPATELVPGLLVAEGQLTGSPLTFGQRQDVAFGWQLAREMGRLDVGQSVVVKGRAVLAVEAVEGTDECIRRAGKLCPLGGFTVVKVAKPQQDMRFDVPTIGEGTLRTMAEAGGKVLAVEADRTILIDQPAFVQVAQRLGITVVALRHAQLAQEPAAA